MWPSRRAESKLNDVIGALKELLAKLERHVEVFAAPPLVIADHFAAGARAEGAPGG